MAVDDPGDGSSTPSAPSPYAVTSSYQAISGGYFNLPLVAYTGAVIVVGLPIIYLGQRNPAWVWKYTFLILLTLLLYYRKAFTRFGSFFNEQVSPLRNLKV
jgi:hypothetical protein